MDSLFIPLRLSALQLQLDPVIPCYRSFQFQPDYLLSSFIIHSLCLGNSIRSYHSTWPNHLPCTLSLLPISPPLSSILSSSSSSWWWWISSPLCVWRCMNKPLSHNNYDCVMKANIVFYYGRSVDTITIWAFGACSVKWRGQSKFTIWATIAAVVRFFLT